MATLETSTARRRDLKTTVGIRCVAAYFLFTALVLTGGTVFMVSALGDFQPGIDTARLIGFSLSVTVLLVLISIGLYRHWQYVRWAAVAVSLYMAIGGSVIGIMLFMYLIRPELDGRFV